MGNVRFGNGGNGNVGTALSGAIRSTARPRLVAALDHRHGCAFLALLVAVIAAAGCGAEPSAVGTTRLALAAGNVQGLVRDNLGAPVGGARVEFRVPATGVLAASPISDATGAFGAALQDGIYDVAVLPSSFFLAQTFPGQIVVGDTKFTFVLVRANETVSGHVRGPKGQALPDQMVCLQGCESGGACQRVCGTSDSDGRYSLNVLPGTYRLEIDHRQFVPTVPYYFLTGPEVVVTAEGGVVQDVVIRNHMLRGQVVNGSDPVDGATVLLAGSKWTLTCYSVDGPELDGTVCALPATTGMDGHFELPIIEGSFVLQASVDDTTAVPIVVAESEDDPSDVVIPMGGTPLLRGRIDDFAGTGLADQQVCLQICGWTHSLGCTTICDATDADGNYGLDVPAGRYWFAVDHRVFTSEIPYYYLSGSQLDLTPTVMSTRDQTVPIRRLSVEVLDAADQPARDAAVYISSPRYLSCYSVTFEEMAGSGCFSPGRTGDDGAYRTPVLEGSFQLQVAGAKTTATVDVTVSGDTTVPVKLPAQAALAGLVHDRDGGPLGGQTVCLDKCDDTTGCTNVCVDSGPEGQYAFNTPPGTYNLRVRQDFITEAVPRYSLAGPTVTVTGVPTIRDIRIPNYRLRGQVVDVDGQPAAGALVGIETKPGWYGCYTASTDDFQGSACVVAQTANSSGRFEIPLLPPLVPAIQVVPPTASGLATFMIRDLVVTGDLSLVVAVQFLQESVFVPKEEWSPDHPATTDSEGDGATFADPVETSVFSPAAGNVRIEEGPITQESPSGYSFLTQQVNITADPPGPGKQLKLIFRIDCSRFPFPLACGENLAVSKNGTLVDSCLKVADPCVFERSIVGDDVQIIVYTETASAWNFAVPLPPDSDGDGIRDSADACPDQPEDVDGVADSDGCPDPDPQPPVDAGSSTDAIPTSDGGVPVDGGGAPRTDGGADRQPPPDPDPDPPPHHCADVDGDGRVTGHDVQIIRQYVRDRRHRGDGRDLDVNQDGKVNERDVDLAEQQLGRRCRPSCRTRHCSDDHRCGNSHDHDHSH